MRPVGIGVSHIKISMKNKRLKQQIDFILEIDRLKTIFRQSYLIGERRRENSAEHSWHVAIMATILAEYSDETINADKTAKMLLIHDIVEIDAGDTYCYDETGASSKIERENQAADRIFSLLPDDQTADFRSLWDEFEARQTPEAKFAAAIDRIMPILHNVHTEGKSWKEHDISRGQVMKRAECVRDISAPLWEAMQSILDDAVSKGYLKN